MKEAQSEEDFPTVPLPELALTPYGADRMFTPNVAALGGLACLVGDVASGATDDNETRTEEDGTKWWST